MRSKHEKIIVNGHLFCKTEPKNFWKVLYMDFEAGEEARGKEKSLAWKKNWKNASRLPSKS